MSFFFKKRLCSFFWYKACSEEIHTTKYYGGHYIFVIIIKNAYSGWQLKRQQKRWRKGVKKLYWPQKFERQCVTLKNVLLRSSDSCVSGPNISWPSEEPDTQRTTGVQEKRWEQADQTPYNRSTTHTTVGVLLRWLFKLTDRIYPLWQMWGRRGFCLCPLDWRPGFCFCVYGKRTVVAIRREWRGSAVLLSALLKLPWR